MNYGGIILCGGKSTRMGRPKFSLPFGDETLLERVVRLMGSACRPLVVVAAADQFLPELPAEVIVARDQHPERGPLEGIAAGLRALPEAVDAAYITACDVPFLEPAFVRRMGELLGDHAAAVPAVGGFVHPLSAVYRRSLIDVVEQLLITDRRAPSQLFDVVSTRRVSASELTDVDETLATLDNINTPEQYAAALARLRGANS